MLRDGRAVAVKVQYPGVDTAIQADLDNAEVLYGLFSAFALKGLDVHALVDELRERMGDELDYRIEAAHQSEFARSYRGHPFITVPRRGRRAVDAAGAHDRVGRRHDVGRLPGHRRPRPNANAPARCSSASPRARSTGSASSTATPTPATTASSPDGRVAFLDFGLVKRWTPGEWERLSPCLDAILADDPDRLVAAMEAVSFLPPGHGLDPQAVFDYVSTPYRPYLTEHFRFTREFMADTVQRVTDVHGPYAEVVAKLNLPASFVILDRVVWGVSRAARQARGGGPVAGHPGRVPGGRAPVHTARRGGRRVVGRPRRRLRLTTRAGRPRAGGARSSRPPAHPFMAAPTALLAARSAMNAATGCDAPSRPVTGRT